MDRHGTFLIITNVEIYKREREWTVLNKVATKGKNE